MIKKLLGILIPALLLLALYPASVLPVYADGVDYTSYMPPPDCADKVNVYYLYNIDSGVVAAEKNSTVKVCPASTVKIMAGLLLCEKYAERTDEYITVTKDMAAHFSGHSLGLVKDENVSVKDLLHAAICGSYNDALIVLACDAGGSINGFLNLMNARAEKLGMTNSAYTDVTGIDAGVDMTAADLSLCCLEAYKNQLYMNISSERSADLSATNKRPAQTIYNRNSLIYDTTPGLYANQICRGMNSGCTTAGGWCLATVAEKDDAHYLCIVLGAEEDDSTHVYSYITANKLIKSALSVFSNVNLSQTWNKITVPVEGAKLMNTETTLGTEKDIFAFIPTQTLADGSVEFITMLDSDTLTAPVTAGQPVGYLVVRLNGSEIGRTRLVCTEDITQNKIVGVISAVGNFVTGRAFIASVIIAVILTSLYLIFFAPHKKAKVKTPKIKTKTQKFR